MAETSPWKPLPKRSAMNVPTLHSAGVTGTVRLGKRRRKARKLATVLRAVLACSYSDLLPTMVGRQANDSRGCGDMAPWELVDMVGADDRQEAPDSDANTQQHSGNLISKGSDGDSSPPPSGDDDGDDDAVVCPVHRQEALLRCVTCCCMLCGRCPIAPHSQHQLEDLSSAVSRALRLLSVVRIQFSEILNDHGSALTDILSLAQTKRRLLEEVGADRVLTANMPLEQLQDEQRRADERINAFVEGFNKETAEIEALLGLFADEDQLELGWADLGMLEAVRGRVVRLRNTHTSYVQELRVELGQPKRRRTPGGRPAGCNSGERKW